MREDILVSGCSVGKMELQVGKIGSQVGIIVLQVGKLITQVRIVKIWKL